MSADASYKGILLCERPAYTSRESAFIPSSAPERMEPWGINPIRKVHAISEAKDSLHSNLHYKRWLIELGSTQEKMKNQELQTAEAQVAKKHAIASFSEKLRTAVLSGEKVSTFWRAAKGQAIKHASVPSPSSDTKEKASNVKASDGHEQADSELLKEVQDFVEALCSEAKAGRGKGNTAEKAASLPDVQATSQTSTAQHEAAERNSSHAGASSINISCSKSKVLMSCSEKRKKQDANAKNNKPAWALSEEQAQEVQLEEELELLKFAENLDFEEFVGKLDDVELQNTYEALEEAEGRGTDDGDDRAWRKSFVRALNQAAFKQVQRTNPGMTEGDGLRADDNHSVAGFSESAVSRVTVSTRARTQEATAAKLAAASGSSAAGDGNNWDSTSRVGDDTDIAKSAGTASRLRAAEEFLMENPELKGVHSTASVRTMLAKAEIQAAAVELV